MKNEMGWVTQFFFRKAEEWDSYLAPSLGNGQVAYAEHQKAVRGQRA